MTSRLPVVFTAHGNPMNAARDNAFTRFLREWRRTLPRPLAILAVSAHWETTRLTASTASQPETLHDFSGFPEELYKLRYPAPGAPGAAERALELLRDAGFEAIAEPNRGLDHGAWAPLLGLYPEAGVPVAQLSLLRRSSLARQLEIGRALRPLRDEGVLVLGSGNVTHNLRTADLAAEDLPVEAWAAEFDAGVKDALGRGDFPALAALGESAQGRRAHPTLEHFAPLLLACGAAGEAARVTHAFEGFEHATLSMRCVRWD